ncbi:MAG: PAS domain S-box protein, partial [Desulfobacterales bacterium]|nr:PAS domain S-box protein [Desulfobacterales bacterium]
MNRKSWILIVDDEVDMALNLKDIFEHQGYGAMIAHDGLGAQNLCAERNFDLGLIDIKLPDARGLDLIKTLSGRSPDMDFILITGHASIDSAIEAVGQKKIVAYEQKPLDMNHFLQLIRQVVERKRAEEALRRERDFNASLVDTARAIILVLDPEGRIVRFNPYMEEISGYSLGEVKGEDWFKAFPPPAERLESRARFEKAVEGVRTMGAVHAIVTKDGSKRDIEWHDETLKDMDGNVVGLLAIGRDITERLQAEKALRESEERLRLITENMEDIFWLGVNEDDVRFLYMSPAYEKFSAHKIETLYRDPNKWLENVHEEDRERVVKAFQTFLQGKGKYDIEWKLPRPDGSFRWMWVKQIAISEKEGRVHQFIGIARDITTRKRAEEEKLALERRLRRAEKAESLSCMAGAVAHHFNNMLAGIIGNMELVMEELPRGAHPWNRLDQAQKAARSAAEMSGLMLTYLGQSRGKPEPLDLAELCRRRLSRMRAAMPRDVILETDLPTLGPVIEADMDQMRQVLNALITNAGEAMNELSGKVRVSVDTVNTADIP